MMRWATERWDNAAITCGELKAGFKGTCSLSVSFVLYRLAPNSQLLFRIPKSPSTLEKSIPSTKRTRLTYQNSSELKNSVGDNA